MSETIELVIQRRIAGHRLGEIVTVDVNDERWADHVLAGNAAALPEIADAVAGHDDLSLNGSGYVPVDDEDHGLDDEDLGEEE